MRDLHEELGRLADAVGEPVSFRQLEVTRQLRERRRRTSSIVVALVLVLAVGAFFGATYATFTSTPPVSEGPPASTQPSKHDHPPKPPINQPRCLNGLRIIGNGSQLVTCAVWPPGTPVTVSFTVKGPARMKLALYPRLGCSEYGCDRAPLWRAKPFTGPGETTYRIRGLKFGRYVLIDRLHPATARTVILVG